MEEVFLLLLNYLNSEEYKKELKLEKLLNTKIDNFIKEYNTSFISNMSLDDYVVGKEINLFVILLKLK